jgi:hypothetical protein
MPAKTTETHEPEIYREVVVATLARTGITVFVVLTLFLLAMFVYLITAGGDSALGWVYLAMGLYFAFLTFLIYSVSKLTISATSQSITVRCGIFKRVMRWEDISNCYLYEASPFDFSSGWGIRIGRVNGKRRLVYNVLGWSCVVLELKKGRFAEFAFSTKNPDAVMDVIKKYIIDSK